MGKKTWKDKQTGNGSGTIYPRKNKHGKITSYRSEYGEVGKRQYVSVKTITECREKLRRAMNEYERGHNYTATTTESSTSSPGYRASRTRCGLGRGSGTSS